MSPPADLKTLDEQTSASDTSEVAYKGFVSSNLGNRTFRITLTLLEMFSRTQVANDRTSDDIAQRRLDPAHARKLAIYILKGLVTACVRAFERTDKAVPNAFHRMLAVLGDQPYVALQPVVANLRTCARDGGDVRGRWKHDRETGETICFEFFLGLKDVLWIVDGQHRRWAVEMVLQFLKEVLLYGKYPKKSLYPADAVDVSAAEMEVWNECSTMARQCSIDVELHLGLSVEEERQLFHDLNNLGKKVEASLSFDFDNSNPVNAFIKDELIGKDIVGVVEKDVVNWKDDRGQLARKDLVAVNAHLFLNKSNINGATPPKVDAKTGVAKRFWDAVAAIPGFGEPGAKTITVAAQPVVLKALAKLTYDFTWGKWAPEEGEDNPMLDKLLDGLTEIDFSHDNPIWRYFEMTDNERKKKGLEDLADYLPKSEGNRDIGQFQNGVMRFGAKHNDIFPIIGDMVRWKLGLPNRHAGDFDEIPEAASA
jgi:hypothetical protein